MAIAFVQGPAAVQGDDVSSISATFASTTADDNLIVACSTNWFSDPPETHTITDEASNTWFEAITQTGDITPGGNEDLRANIAYAYNITGTTTHFVTCTPSGVSDFCLAINEYSGVEKDSDPQDFQSGASVEFDTNVDAGALDPGAASHLYIAVMTYAATETTITKSLVGQVQRQEIESLAICAISVSDVIGTGSKNLGFNLLVENRAAVCCATFIIDQAEAASAVPALDEGMLVGGMMPLSGGMG